MAHFDLAPIARALVHNSPRNKKLLGRFALVRQLSKGVLVVATVIVV